MAYCFSVQDFIHGAWSAPIAYKESAYI